jgi:hypothetical protein
MSHTLESWCDDATHADEHTLELQAFFSDCGLILDNRFWDVHYDMSKCMWKWVKHIFSKLSPKKLTRGIGLHICWVTCPYHIADPGDTINDLTNLVSRVYAEKSQPAGDNL